MGVLACYIFISRSLLASKGRSWHPCQTAHSVGFGRRVCLLAVWSKNLTISPQPSKFKIFQCKIQLLVKIAHSLQSLLHKSCTLNFKYRSGKSNGKISFFPKNKGGPFLLMPPNFLKAIPLYFRSG